MKRLEGKVAVVTGGNSGIGLATAKRFQEEGARVAISGRDRKTLDVAVKTIGNGLVAVQADVSKLTDVDKLYAEVSKKLGKIDVINTSFSELHVAGKSIAWLLDSRVAGGGPLMDLGVYCVNTSRWLVEEDPEEVNAHAWKKDAERFKDVEEGISFRMHFASGLVVQGTSTYSSVISSFVFVQGTRGWACLTPAFPFDEERRLTGKIGGKWFEKKFRVLDEFAPELDAFAAAILTKKAVAPDGRQGHRDMCILEAIYASARKREPVDVRYGVR